MDPLFFPFSYSFQASKDNLHSAQWVMDWLMSTVHYSDLWKGNGLNSRMRKEEVWCLPISLSGIFLFIYHADNSRDIIHSNLHNPNFWSSYPLKFNQLETYDADRRPNVALSEGSNA